ncbi:MAG: hypothetical protein NUV97_02375 [archaeon]|nr:hypothetical protein [archaeon]MCR4323792.1 hypothetical protein [Nanoarchaeota archaeon]
MVFVEDIPNLSDVVTFLPGGITQNLDKLVFILKAAGVLFLIYVLYLIINGIINYRRYKGIKRIERKVDLILKRLKIDSKEKHKR